MSCLENVTLPSCVWFEGGDKRNAIASILAGTLFFTGWWIIIDMAAVHPGELPGAAHLCGVFATLSLLMVNTVSNAQVRGETYEGGCMGPRGARLWLFLGFIVGFASLIAASLILFTNYVGTANEKWPGVSLLLQNAFIFAASLTFKFGRTEDTWG